MLVIVIIISEFDIEQLLMLNDFEIVYQNYQEKMTDSLFHMHHFTRLDYAMRLADGVTFS